MNDTQVRREAYGIVMKKLQNEKTALEDEIFRIGSPLKARDQPVPASCKTYRRQGERFVEVSLKGQRIADALRHVHRDIAAVEALQRRL